MVPRAWLISIAIALMAGCTALLDFDLEIGPAATGGGGEGGSATTSTPSAGGQGGGGAPSAGGGGMGGSIGVLVDRGLVFRYFLDEDGGTTLADAAPQPVPLTFNEEGNAALAGRPGARGIAWLMAQSQGDARAVITANKIEQSFHGASTATLEVVAHVLALRTNVDAFSLANLFIVSGGGDNGGLAINVQTPTSVGMSWNGGANIGVWPFPILTAGRVVLHTVLDTSDVATTVRLYVDGMQVDASTNTATPPAAGDAIDLTGDNQLVLGNGVNLPYSFQGELGYAAAYSVALDSAEIDQNAKRLQLSDDTN